MAMDIQRGIFNWFKKILPPMSETEQQAISAGDVWFEADLFQGKPDWDKFLANPKPILNIQEQAFLDTHVETACAMLDEWQITHVDYDLPANVWNYFKTAGFFGLNISPEHGGLGFSALANSTIVQKIATKSLSAAVTVMVPNSLGPGELLTNYGTEQQKQQYLHKLARGTEIPCFALTSPEAGSDATSITDTGVICYGDYAGKKNVLGMRLNWDKRYITLAPIATLIGLAIKMQDPDNILGSERELGITVVLVPRDTNGVEIGHRHFPLNQAFMNGPIRGQDVFLPLDFIIGGQAKIGQGWQMLVECLAAGRGISLPALSTAMGKHCYRTTGSYAKLRQQFNLSIGKFEGVATSLARIGGLTYLLESTRLLTVSAIDQHIRPSVITAIAKYHMTEMSRQVMNAAMDIHGGRGIMLGPRNYLARLYEGVPIGITVEGANILTRCLMIFGQGAIRCHPYVLQEISAKNASDFSNTLEKHIKYSFINYLKLSLHSYTFMFFCKAPKNQWQKYYKKLSFLSLALAFTADLAMLFLGGNLKRKENLSARLGDILSYLYMASAVLKYSNDNGNQEEEKPLVEWSLQYCLYNIQHSFEYFCVNFPNKFISKPLQWLVFPPWRNFLLPSDDLNIKISNYMLQPSEFRERITADCAFSRNTNDPVGRIELAWLKMIEIEPLLAILKKLDKNLSVSEKIQLAINQKLITSEEAKMIEEFEVLRLDAMQVDEFTTYELTGKKA